MKIVEEVVQEENISGILGSFEANSRRFRHIYSIYPVLYS